jgi:hypothetical protein
MMRDSHQICTSRDMHSRALVASRSRRSCTDSDSTCGDDRKHGLRAGDAGGNPVTVDAQGRTLWVWQRPSSGLTAIVAHLRAVPVEGAARPVVALLHRHVRRIRGGVIAGVRQRLQQAVRLVSQAATQVTELTR